MPEHPDYRIHAAMNAEAYDDEAYLGTLEWQAETAPKYPPLPDHSCYLDGVGGKDVVNRLPAGSDRLPPSFGELFESIALPKDMTLHKMLLAAAAIAAAFSEAAAKDGEEDEEDEEGDSDNGDNSLRAAAGCCQPASGDGAALAARLKSVARRVGGAACNRLAWVATNGNCLLCAAAAALHDRGLLGGLGLSTEQSNRTGMLEQAASTLRTQVADRMRSTEFQHQHRARGPGECYDPAQDRTVDFESIWAEATAFASDGAYATPLAVQALAFVTGVDVQTIVVNAGHTSGYEVTYGHGQAGEVDVDDAVQPLRIVWDQPGVHFWPALQGQTTTPEHRAWVRSARGRGNRRCADG